MIECFRGRRKVGVLMLLLVCFITAGWVMSYLQRDVLSFNVLSRHVAADSVLGRIHLFRYDDYVIWSETFKKPMPLFHWETINVCDERSVIEDRIFSDVPFGMINSHIGGVFPIFMKCEIPYWAIVIPLTAISAFLLLSKPRKSTPKKVSQPTASKGA